MLAVIIQARLGSTRLPGKVMKKVLGKTLLAYLVERLRRTKTLKEIIVATTTASKDTPLARHAKSLGVRVFRGDEKDVLDRYYKAATAFKVDIIVRITADCPLMDPEVVDTVVGVFTKSAGRYDYVSNVLPQTFPIGMAVEVFSFSVLAKMWEAAKMPSEREHVTLFVRNHMREFRTKNVTRKKDCSHFRVTVDTPEDLFVVRSIFKRLYEEKKEGSMQEILEILEKEPNLCARNAHVHTILQERHSSNARHKRTI